MMFIYCMRSGTAYIRAPAAGEALALSDRGRGGRSVHILYLSKSMDAWVDNHSGKSETN